MGAFVDEAAIARDYALFLKLGVFTHSEVGWLEFRKGFVGGGEAARRWFSRRSCEARQCPPRRFSEVP
jgi:hypothetical protein